MKNQEILPSMDQTVGLLTSSWKTSRATAAARGQFFLTWEIAVTLAGQLMDINPLNEEVVVQTKTATDAVVKQMAAGQLMPDEPIAQQGGIKLFAGTGIAADPSLTDGER